MTYSYEYGCVSYRTGFQDLGDGYYVQADSYSGPCYGTGFSYVYLSKYAADYVVFSSYHDLVYGTVSEYRFENHVGTYVNVANRLDTRFIVGTDVGVFGGSLSLTELFTYPYDYVWDYEVDYGGYLVQFEGHQHYNQIYGSVFGQTTP